MSAPIINKNCLNCDQPVSGYYCSNCGQKSSTSRLFYHQFLQDLQLGVFNIDRGMVRNLMTIFFPRQILDYVHGKRVQFFNPLLYLLIAAGIWMFVIPYLIKKIGLLEISTKEDSFFQGTYRTGYFIGRLIKSFGQYFAASGIVPLAFSSRIVFGEHQLNFWEHLYLHIFVVANILLSASFFSAVNIITGWSLPVLLWVTAYGVFAYYQIFSGKEKFGYVLMKVFAMISLSVFFFLAAALLVGYIGQFFISI